MKQTQISKLLALGIILSIAAVGCKSTRYGVTPLGDKGRAHSQTELSQTSRVSSDAPAISADEKGLFSTTPRGTHEGWKQNAELFKAYTVHFDYDSSVIKPAERKKLEAVAEQLKSNSSAAVKVEGHCDERGTEEYNRSLGERRALALREELIQLGIEATRVDTISFGEDKPAAQGHDEAAWKQNRRGEFIELTPPSSVAQLSASSANAPTSTP